MKIKAIAFLFLITIALITNSQTVANNDYFEGCTVITGNLLDNDTFVSDINYYTVLYQYNTFPPLDSLYLDSMGVFFTVHRFLIFVFPFLTFYVMKSFLHL
jgi:hypothetical protein